MQKHEDSKTNVIIDYNGHIALFSNFFIRTHASAKGEIMHIHGGICTIIDKLVEFLQRSRRAF